MCETSAAYFPRLRPTATHPRNTGTSSACMRLLRAEHPRKIGVVCLVAPLRPASHPLRSMHNAIRREAHAERSTVRRPPMGRCYVAHRRSPYIRSADAIEASPPAGRKICIGCYLGALLACERCPPFVRASPQRPHSRPISTARRRTNVLTLDAKGSLPKPAQPFRSRRWSLAARRFSPAAASLLPRFPTPRGLRSLRSRAPRHAFPPLCARPIGRAQTTHAAVRLICPD